MNIELLGIQRINNSLLILAFCLGSSCFGEIDLTQFSETLERHQEEAREIYKSLDKLSEEKLSDKEVKQVVLGLRNGLLLGDQIVMKGLIILFENEHLSEKSKEYVWLTILEVLENGTSLVDFEVKHYLHRRFLTTDGETLSPSSEIYLDDLWEGLSPEAGKIYLKRLSKAHQRALLFDLIRRAGPAVK